MNKNGALSFAATVAVVLAVALLAHWLRPAARPNSPRPVASPPHPTPSAQAAQNNLAVRGLQSLYAHMQQAGARLVPPVGVELERAVASGDRGTIGRAFGESIEDRFNQREEALTALRPFTTNADPYVRLLAAQELLRAGDPAAAVPALLALVNTPGPVMDHGNDLRQQAAHQLLKYRVKEAVPGAAALFTRAPDGGLLDGLAANGQAGSGAADAQFYCSDKGFERYAKLGMTKFNSNLVQVFHRTSDPELKNAAAWALARLNHDPAYVDFLVQTAEPAITSKRHGVYSNEALRYLGSLDEPAARQTLERALDSANPRAVDLALVNLLFNQREPSAKAHAVLLREIDTPVGERATFSLLMKIAAARLDDPEVRAAAERADARGSDRLWTHSCFRRAQWPIYDWVDAYVTDYQPTEP